MTLAEKTKRLGRFSNPRVNRAGLAGATGRRGTTGTTGTQGEQGEQGEPGEDFDGGGGGGGPQAWPTLFGTVDPNGAVTPSGIGQWYKNTATGDTWVNQDGTITGWI